MGSWSVREARILCLAVCLLFCCAILFPPPGARASEPFGHILLDATWSDGERSAAQAGAGPLRKVRLSVRSLVRLDDARLTVSVPSTLGIKAAEPSWDDKFLTVAAGERHRAIRAELVRLDPREQLDLVFDIMLPPGGGGVVSFSIEGRTSEGRLVHEAIGFAAREPGASGTPRLGTIEFPANAVPPEGPR